MTGPGAAGATGRGSRSAWWVGALSVVIVALLAAATIPMPFTGDQALFQLGARVLDHGGVLYRDFWDPKQPGIYLFHLLAGWAFGFDEVGAHALETVWAVGFAVVLLRTERHRYEHRWVASVVPLLTIAPVYAAATPSLLGQVEMLVSLPVYLSLWWAVAAGDADGPRPGHLAASGAVGAVVACFKLPYVLLPAIGWVVAVGLRARAGPRSRALAAGGWIALGFAVPSAIVVAYLGAHGQLGDVWHTWFVFPLGVAGRAGRPLTLLGASGRWFVERFAPLLVLGALGLVRLARRGLDRWTATVLAWCAFAAGLVLVQLWWQYLFLLLVVPLGLLAAQGVDELATRVRAPGSHGAGGVAAVVVACAVLTVFLAVDLGRSARPRRPRPGAHRRRSEPAPGGARRRVRVGSAGPGRPARSARRRARSTCSATPCTSSSRAARGPWP